MSFLVRGTKPTIAAPVQWRSPWFWSVAAFITSVATCVTWLSSQIRIITCQMTNGDPPGFQLVRLKERSVLCEFSACEESAAFLLKRPPNQVRALCKAHLKEIGISDEEIVAAE